MRQSLYTSLQGSILTLLIVALARCASTESLPEQDATGTETGGAGGTNGASGTAGGSSSGGGATAPSVNVDAGAGGGGSSVADAEACARSSAVAEPVPAVIEVLLDTSGSMRWVPGENREPAAGEQSKLEITRAALNRAFDAMSNETAVGVFFYPGRADDVAGDCLAEQTSLDIAPLSPGHRQELASSLSQAVAQGGTPTYDAYLRALAELEATPEQGDKYLVLITDGVPTYAADCAGNGTDPVSLDSVQAAAQQAASRGIRTFVVGSPGSEDARDALSRVASFGGSAAPGCADTGPVYCHFDMTTATDFAASLNAALTSIASQTLSCSYDIPAPPGGTELDKNRVNVTFTSSAGDQETILRDPSSGSCTEGWQYSPDGARIVLCNATCQRIQSRPDAKVEILFGCATQIAPVK